MHKRCHLALGKQLNEKSGGMSIIQPVNPKTLNFTYHGEHHEYTCPYIPGIPSAIGPPVRRCQGLIVLCKQTAMSNDFPRVSGGANEQNNQHMSFRGCTEPSTFTYFMRSIRKKLLLGHASDSFEKVAW